MASIAAGPYGPGYKKNVMILGNSQEANSPRSEQQSLESDHSWIGSRPVA
jgi:hypothetical protein